MLAWFIGNQNIPIEDMCKLPEGSGQQLRHSKLCKTSNLREDRTIALGHHSDGVPFAKNQSVECHSWNILALEGCERILFCMLENIYFCSCGCLGRCTVNAILEIFVWSLNCLFTGVWPSLRHDGTPWSKHDKRANRHTHDSDRFGFHAILEECRGDWPAFKKLFGFKGWSAHTNICWMCGADADPDSKPWWDFTSNAKWRSSRLSTFQFLKLLEKNKVSLCKLFEAPCFDISMVMVDVLHCLDLGVSQDALGNLFWLVVSTKVIFDGTTIKARVALLLRKIMEFYKVHKPVSRLSNLTPEMIKRDSKTPKFRGKGAETRYLVPFGKILATELYEKTKETFHASIKAMFEHLLTFYELMGIQPYNAELAGEVSKKFCILYHDISKATRDGVWKLKPKFHLFVELGQYQTVTSGDPSKFWCYKDEDFVGFLSKVSVSKGGKRSAKTIPENAIADYRVL